MLDLDVCDKCIRKRVFFSAGIHKARIRRNGKISCPVMLWADVSLHSAPPKECPYKFEHAVASSVNIDKNRD